MVSVWARIVRAERGTYARTRVEAVTSCVCVWGGGSRASGCWHPPLHALQLTLTRTVRIHAAPGLGVQGRDAVPGGRNGAQRIERFKHPALALAR